MLAIAQNAHAVGQVLEDFSNALIEDSRVFHIADQDFVSMYNQQGEVPCHVSPLG